jgi:hypothetical protein
MSRGAAAEFLRKQKFWMSKASRLKGRRNRLSAIIEPPRSPEVGHPLVGHVNDGGGHDAWFQKSCFAYNGVGFYIGVRS